MPSPLSRPEFRFARPLAWTLAFSTAGSLVVTSATIAAIAATSTVVRWLVGMTAKQVPGWVLDDPWDWYSSTWVGTLVAASVTAGFVGWVALWLLRRWGTFRTWRPTRQGLTSALVVALTGPVWWSPLPSLMSAIFWAFHRYLG